MKKRFGLVAAGLLALTMAGCSTQIEKGTSLLKEEKYEEAAEVFEKASGKSSMEREAYRGLGISYFELGSMTKLRQPLRRLWKKESRRRRSYITSLVSLI